MKAAITTTELEHPDMGAHERLARAVAASDATKDVRIALPFQHALGRAPDLDGRFYTPEYEALPTVQAEIVDETHGNNKNRMQDSEVNFLHRTFQNRASREGTDLLPWDVRVPLAQGQESYTSLLRGCRSCLMFRNQ